MRQRHEWVDMLGASCEEIQGLSTVGTFRPKHSVSALVIYDSPRRRIRSRKEIECEMDSQSYGYELDALAIRPAKQRLGKFNIRPADRIIDSGSLREVANKEN
jgi:hypothetical protein